MAKNKMNKKEMVDFISANVEKVKSNSTLFDVVSYTLKQAKDDIHKVTNEDLMDVIEDIKGFFKREKAPVEALVKKGNAKPATTPSTPSAPADVAPVAPQEQAKTDKKVESKPATKPAEKAPAKTEPKAEVKKAEPKAEPKKVEMFPATIASPVGELTKRTDIKSLADLDSLIASGTEIVFAFYLTKADLRKGLYDPSAINKDKIKEFPSNLDLAQAVYASKSVAYPLSIYSEVMYCVLDEDFEEVDGIMYSCGVEFSTYEITTPMEQPTE